MDFEQADSDFDEALDLLESCLHCDLVYSYEDVIGLYADPDKRDPKTVADVVRAFLAKHGRKT